MGRTDTEPVVGDNWGKGRMEKPGVFKAENRATRGFGGDREVKRSVVGGGATGGSQGGVRKGQTPIRIYQDSIKTSKNRGVLEVGPSELPVEQGDFDKPKIVDEIVKLSCFRAMKNVIRLVPRRSSEVKVSHEGYRAR
jgi:hypothetical protein